jgi:hypothetical protein
MGDIATSPGDPRFKVIRNRGVKIMSSTLTRKEFFSLTIAAGASLVVGACGDDTSGAGGSTSSSTGAGPGSSSTSGSSTTVSSSSNGTGTASAGTTSTGSGGGCPSDVVAEISCPHDPPHALTVSAADIAAGVDKTYDIKGQATHSHMVTVTAADFATLQAGGTVFKFVEAGPNQDHCVTIACGAPGDPMTSGQCDGGNAFSCNGG